MYHAHTVTDAQALADLLGNDHDNFLAPHGTPLDTLARALGAKVTVNGIRVRYDFEDDSAIIVTANEWRVA